MDGHFFLTMHSSILLRSIIREGYAVEQGKIMTQDNNYQLVN